MEIEFNPGRVPATGPSQPAQRQDAASAATDGTSFGITAALQDTLKNLPATRPEMVAQAQALVSDSTYPPSDVLDRIAVLLAIHVRGQ